jgi:hypothetical protein
MPCSCDRYDNYTPAQEIRDLHIQLCRAQSIIYKLNKSGLAHITPDLKQAVVMEIDMLRNHKMEEYLRDAKSDFNEVSARVAKIQDLGGVAPPDLIATTEPSDLELLG